MLPTCVINPVDKLARHRWRKFMLILITTDEKLAATAPTTSFWDAPQQGHPLEQDAADMHEYDDAY